MALRGIDMAHAPYFWRVLRTRSTEAHRDMPPEMEQKMESDMETSVVSVVYLL